MYLFVPKDEKYRHLILKTLVERQSNYSGEKLQIDCKEIAVHADELAKILKIPVKKTRQIVGGLIVSEDVKRCETTGERFLYIVGQKGYASYIENTYLKRGRAYRMSLVKDNLYIIVSLIAIISSLSSLVLYLSSTINLQKEVLQLRREVQELKEPIPKNQQTK